jgi:protein-S-isoprenylcysteine O-methyltransferase Ste14
MLVFRPTAWGPGLVLVALGEAVRLAAVGHIGVRSRTRSVEVGPLVDTGPYARTRNPLYLGNLLIWAGVGVVTWPSAVVAVPILVAYYAAIVAWEERNLAERLGKPYADYTRRVPRWLPLGSARPGAWDARRALRSERSTLLAIVCVLGALCARAAVP